MPLVIAHRGARGHAPENTLTSAALGHAVKADLWELDVNYTKDYKLVVVHDDTLVRTTNVEEVYPGRPSYRVCDFTLEELGRLDAGCLVRRPRPVRTRGRRRTERRHPRLLQGTAHSHAGTGARTHEALRLGRERGN